MSEVKGPWKYSHEQTPYYNEQTGEKRHMNHFYIRDNENMLVSSLFIGTKSHGNLIASAPELFEAIQKLDSIWLAHGCETSIGQCYLCEMHTKLNVQYLIKKAKGEL